MGNIGILQLLVVALMILLVFGSKRLRSLGSDLGSSIQGFKRSMAEQSSVQSKETESDSAKQTST